MPWALYDLIEKAARDRGFKSVARYFIATATKDIFHERHRLWIRNMANCDPKIQDKLLYEVLHLSTTVEDWVGLSEWLMRRRKERRK